MADRLHKPLQLHINGQDVPAKSNRTFPVSNPMNGVKLFDCASAGIEDYEDAIQHAHTAFKNWSKSTPSQRRLIFLRAADILTTYLDDPSDASAILTHEVSAVPSYVKLNILAAAAILRDTAGLVTHIKGEMIPADRPETTILVKREPMGVIFAMSPWNAPVNLTARAIASPLICGNSVVLKPSENSPKSQHLMVRALTEAGLPAGCLNYLPTSSADAPAVTQFAINHKFVRKVNFTGSDRVGKIIAGYAASCLKTALLELGGKAPAVVLEDAVLEDAVDAIVFGTLLNSGQICMSTERVIVHHKVADEFVRLLMNKFKDVKVGNHLEDPSVSLSGLFSSAAPKRIMSLIEDAVSQGADLVFGDRQISGPNDTIITPHIVDKVTPSMSIFQDESFGPVLCRAGFIACCNALSHDTFDLRPMLKKVGSSVEAVLLLVGERDANLPQTMREMGTEIATGFANADQVSLKLIKDAGHVPVIDGYLQFRNEVSSFLVGKSPNKI